MGDDTMNDIMGDDTSKNHSWGLPVDDPPLKSPASVERKGATEAAFERHWADRSWGDSELELSMKSRKQSWRVSNLGMGSYGSAIPLTSTNPEIKQRV